MASPTVYGGVPQINVANNRFAAPMGPFTQTTTEANVQRIARIPGYLNNWTVNAIAGTATTMSGTYRQNGANTTLALTFPLSTTGFFRSTNGIHVASGDTFDVQTVSSTGNQLGFSTILTSFSADSGTVGIYWSYGLVTGTSVSFSAPAGIWFSGDGIFAEVVARAPGTASKLFGRVTANTNSAGATVFHFRKNAANGNQSFSVPLSTTGAFEDVTNTDTLANGDSWGWSNDAAATGSLTVGFVGSSITHTTDASEVIGGNMPISFSATGNFQGYCMDDLGPTTAANESECQQQLGYDAKITNFRFNLETNSFTGTAVWTLRKNGVNANNTISVSTTATGNFEDTTHTDIVKPTDLLDYGQTGGTAGSAETSWMASTMTPIPSMASWYVPLSEPSRKLIGLLASQQEFTTNISPLPFVPFSWFMPLSEPARERPRSPAATAQFAAFYPLPLPFIPMSWFVPLSEPPRKRIGLDASRQQFAAMPSRLLPTPQITGVLNATERGDLFFGGGTFWARILSGEVGVIIDTDTGGSVGINVPTAPLVSVGTVETDAPLPAGVTRLPAYKASVSIRTI